MLLPDRPSRDGGRSVATSVELVYGGECADQDADEELAELPRGQVTALEPAGDTRQDGLHPPLDRVAGRGRRRRGPGHLLERTEDQVDLARPLGGDDRLDLGAAAAFD